MSDQERKPRVEILALWKMERGSGYTGRLGSARVVAWPNDRKKNPKEPDLRVYVQEDDRRERGPTASGEKRASEPAPSDDDVGF